jgi:acetate kinase
MTDEEHTRILTINSGSSSLKFALYHMGRSERLMLTGSVERIGLRAGLFQIKDAEGDVLIEQHLDLPDHDAALKALFEWLQSYAPGRDLHAVGHRIVHGGPSYRQPHLITSSSKPSATRDQSHTGR